MRCGGCAGSGRDLRLDPFGLPVRFSASDAAADGRVRDIELHRERIVLRRSLHGMRMALNMPVAAYDGISLCLLPAEDGAQEVLAVVLKHNDPALTLPLFMTSHAGEAVAEWRAWSEVLGVRLLLAEPSASLPTASAQLGDLHVERPRPRPPPERAQSAPSDVSSSARLRQGHQDSTGASWRARDHRAPLAPRRRGFAPLPATTIYMLRMKLTCTAAASASCRPACSSRCDRHRSCEARKWCGPR
ncbi:MAG: DUF6101 family protein [Pseudolabrys sp.]